MASIKNQSCRLVSASAALLAFSAATAEARTFRCASGDVQCLVSSIADANANGRNKNTIRLEAGTYTLVDVDNTTDGANGLPSITSTLTIVAEGTGASIVRDTTAPSFRIFHVASTGHLTLQQVSVMGGVANDLRAGNGGGLFNSGGEVTIRSGVFDSNSARSGGGGLSNNGGSVTISDSAFVRNRGDFEPGGGASGLSTGGGQAVITDCTFDHNLSRSGAGTVLLDGGLLQISRTQFTNNAGAFSPFDGIGGLWVRSGTASVDHATFLNTESGGSAVQVNPDGVLVVTNSAFVGNAGSSATFSNFGTAKVTNTTFARNENFGVFTGSAIALRDSGNMLLTNSTFSENSAPPGNFPYPIISGGSSTFVGNVIIARTPDEEFVTTCPGTVTSLGNNIFSDLSGCTVTLLPSDIIGDPGLGSFTDDGTPGNAHYPLLPGSLAIDAGNPALCTGKDQIGEPRRRTCDIGAIEFQKSGRPR
jgi:hypothetical protein